MTQKILLAGLTLISFCMIGYAAPLAQPIAQEYDAPDYDDDELYTSDNGYSYDDAYSSVDWDRLSDDSLYYSYYDDEDVFMVVVGRRIFIVPYDFFYYRIWPRHRSLFRYCYYDTFWDWWGVPFYNHIWFNYHRHYHYGFGHQYNRHHDFHRDHYRRPRVVIHKDGWRAPNSRNRSTVRSHYPQNRTVYRNNRTVYRDGSSGSSRRIIRRSTQDDGHSRSSTVRRSYRYGGNSRSGSGSHSRSTVRSRSGSSSGNHRSSGGSSRSSGSRSSSGSSSKGSAVRKK